MRDRVGQRRLSPKGWRRCFLRGLTPALKYPTCNFQRNWHPAGQPWISPKVLQPLLVMPTVPSSGVSQKNADPAMSAHGLAATISGLQNGMLLGGAPGGTVAGGPDGWGGEVNENGAAVDGGPNVGGGVDNCVGNKVAVGVADCVGSKVAEGVADCVGNKVAVGVAVRRTRKKMPTPTAASKTRMPIESRARDGFFPRLDGFFPRLDGFFPRLGDFFFWVRAIYVE